MDANVTPQEHAHPGPAEYFRVGITLAVLTALEVAAYEVVRRHTPAGLATVLAPVIIQVLLLLSAAKFALVAMFYMHLKQDHKLFSGVFVFPIIIAAAVILSLLLLFSYMRGLQPGG